MPARADDFLAHQPKIEKNDIDTANREGRVVRSLAGMPLVADNREITGIAVKFALANGSFVTLLLDPVAAMAVHQLADSANSVQWSAAGLMGSPTRH